ncbi:HipA domain-containing protein [Bordetella genomosp. 13]|uniref:HipA domain-containing protein n=1 Tax=Bordetella genomosp. 13 TaxID=463040 RepID=UPI0011A22F8A|nr:HipA domain-containing protein [Bordetella genomosp. 13]
MIAAASANRQGGPSFADCYHLVKEVSAQPAVDLRNLLCWLFFNLYVGNHDTHAKNLSILATPGGLRLAPFYDMMSTRVYPGLGESFAFAIGGEARPGRIGMPHLAELAGVLRVAPRYLKKIAHDMALAVQAAIPAAAGRLDEQLPHAERVVALRLQQMVNGLVRQMRRRLSGDAPGDDPEHGGR